MTDLRALTHALADDFIDQFPQGTIEVLESTPVAELVELLQTQSPERGARILGRLSTALATTVLQQLRPALVRQILGVMDPAQAVLLLSSLSPDIREKHLDYLDAGPARELRDLMSCPQSSAGRLMQPRAPSIPARLTVKQVLNRLRRFPSRDTAVLVVTDDSGKLLGLVDLVDVVQADPATRLKSLLPVVTTIRVNAMTPREEIINLCTRYRLRLLPVVDIDDRLLGVTRQSAVIKATQKRIPVQIRALIENTSIYKVPVILLQSVYFGMTACFVIAGDA